MDNDPASVAEQRANAVAKLKRAASLPRLKNGRRPQMHNEVVSEGEGILHDGVQDTSQDTPSDRVSDVDPKSNVQPADIPGTPEPSTVTRKRRSRSRSRSRGSKDLRKFKPPQSPMPTSITPSNDSSPDDSSPSPKEYIPQSIIAPIPSHLNPLLPTSSFILPGFLTAENSLLSSGASSPVPGFPTLEALMSHQGLQRSNSAGAARMLTLQSTLQKLTGGTEPMQSTFPSPAMSPQPFGKLARNNTVSGGESVERSAARRLMMAQLNKRMIKETDLEEEEEVVRPFSPSKRRQRRRSKRQSINPPVVSATDESDLVSTSNVTRSNTPQLQPEQLAPNIERTSSTTPIPPMPIYPLVTPSINLNETINSSRQSTPVRAVPPSHFDVASRKRRESVLIEDQDDEDRIPPQSTYYGLPGAPSHPSPSISPGPPHPSDLSTDLVPADVTNVPVYLNSLERVPSRQARFLSSPFARPHMEISLSSDQEEERDPDEEEVFPTEAFRRSPYHDGLNREISWVAEPVPETPMPVHEETEEEDDDEDEPLREEPSQHITEDEDDHPPPESPKEEFYPQIGEASPRVSSDSQALIVEASTSPPPTPVITSPTPSLVANLPNTPPVIRGSDELDSQQYPQRLSVAVRIQSDRSPVATEFDQNDVQLVRAETPSSKREGSTWSKFVSTLTRSASSGGRRSRTNSIATRERRQNTDSSISRESGVSLPSPKADKNDSISSATYPHGQPSSPSNSVHSLSQTASTSCVVSSGSMTPSADPLAKYNHEKLNPFPGIKKLQEQWNHRQPLFSSTPDIVLSHHHIEADIPLPSSSSSNTPSNSPEINGDRKLSHQASDTHLLHIYKSQAPPLSASVSTSSHDYYQHPSLHSPSSIMLKSLPTNRDGVRRWLSARKLFPQPSSAGNSPSTTPVPEQKPAVASKKPSLSNLFQVRKENDFSIELHDEWVDVDRDKMRTPAGSIANGQLRKANGEFSPISPSGSSVHDDLQKTPRASKNVRSNGMLYSVTDAFLIPPTPVTPSPPELPSSTTPEPWSSLSDYPHATTSESSSNTSSHGSEYPTKGGILLERLNEMLGRGSRSPIWPSVIDEPPRRFLRCSPVFQVVNSNICKDRFLFLFNDILIIAKPRPEDSDTFLEVTKPNPADRKFTVKNVVLLRNLFFTSEREEPSTRAIPRTPAVQTFVEQFSTDPDHAIVSLFRTLGHRDDPAVLAQFLFKTPHVDRVQLGDYLSRRTSRIVLKHYLDEFGFMGLRVDKALRLFLQSIHIPERGSHGVSPLDVLLESFANRWYEANAGHIAYDKDLAYRFTRAIVQLNDVMHGVISQEPGQMGHPRRSITARDFLDAFRRHDTRLSDELLGDVYDSIRHERLCQARNPLSGGPPEITVTFKRPLPPRLTYRVQSEPVVIRIPQPDPQFSIELFGHDLVFDPPVLSFAKSAEASFRVTGHSFGLKTMTMLRSGPNSLLYTGLAQSYTIAVERAFMRNTFQVAFLDHNGAKRKYMFSVTDPVVRHEWAVSLKREIEASGAAANHPYGISWPSQQTSRFYKASYNMSFKVLQDTLLNPSAVLGNTFPFKVDHALERFAAASLHSRDQSKTSLRTGVDRRPSEPVRSKSRSRMYHRHGPGKMESEGNSLSFPHGLESGDDGGDNPDAQLRSEDQYWSGKDLVMYCQQNSSIALLLAYLQVGTSDLNGSQ